jgi:hypothetical protein
VSLYVCEACREVGKDMKIPADEVGAALMQQHLQSEHDVGLVTEFKACQECGQSVLTKLGQPGPRTCGDHS